MEQKKYKKKILKKRKYIKNRFLRCIIRTKRLYKYKSSILNCKYTYISKFIKCFTIKIYIRLKPNNIFCTLVDLKENKILLNISSGKYKMQTSKKRLKYNSKILLDHFFKDAQKYLYKKKNIILELISPIKIRKRIIRFVKTTLIKKNLILYTNEKKCFNGCRAAKKRRKKRNRIRIFK